MTQGPSGWTKIPVSIRAIITGLLVAFPAADVWTLLLLILGGPLAAIAEAIFLALYLWWVSGGGPPLTTQAVRAAAFRRAKLSPAQWLWAIIAALAFAATIHASLVLLFRFVAFPMAAFRQGYDFSFLPSVTLRWLAILVAAASAGICEETGFRGYMQRPIEQRHGALPAVLISSSVFMVIHLPKGWAIAGMVPIVFGAGVLLGLLAWSSRSLIPGMIGHVVMDIGLFAYWWTGVAGTFTARPVTETGVDQPFLLTCSAFALSLLVVLFAILQLRRKALSTLPCKEHLCGVN